MCFTLNQSFTDVQQSAVQLLILLDSPPSWGNLFRQEVVISTSTFLPLHKIFTAFAVLRLVIHSFHSLPDGRLAYITQISTNLDYILFLHSLLPYTKTCYNYFRIGCWYILCRKILVSLNQNVGLVVLYHTQTNTTVYTLLMLITVNIKYEFSHHLSLEKTHTRNLLSIHENERACYYLIRGHSNFHEWITYLYFKYLNVNS